MCDHSCLYQTSLDQIWEGGTSLFPGGPPKQQGGGHCDHSVSVIRK